MICFRSSDRLFCCTSLSCSYRRALSIFKALALFLCCDLSSCTPKSTEAEQLYIYVTKSCLVVCVPTMLKAASLDVKYIMILILRCEDNVINNNIFCLDHIWKNAQRWWVKFGIVLRCWWLQIQTLLRVLMADKRQLHPENAMQKNFDMTCNKSSKKYLCID